MYIIEMIINIKYSEQNKHNKKEKNWKRWESVLYIITRPTIIKRHYTLFKYFTKGEDFIGGHTSLAMIFTFDFSQISDVPIFVYDNSYFLQHLFIQ